MYAGSGRDLITVGMPNTAVRESRERIKSALINSGFGFPNKAVTINLAPANVRKEGAGFDLAIQRPVYSVSTAIAEEGMARATEAQPHIRIHERRLITPRYGLPEAVRKAVSR